MSGKLNRVMNTVIGASVGAFVGQGLCALWDCKMDPDSYAKRKAPWMRDALIHGAVTGVFMAVAMAVKLLCSHADK